jgi:hypothetical protein
VVQQGPASGQVLFALSGAEHMFDWRPGARVELVFDRVASNPVELVFDLGKC